MIRKVLLLFLSLICILNLSLGTVFAEGEPEPSPEPTPELSEWGQLVAAVADLENAGTGVADVFIVSEEGANAYTITLLKDIVATENDTPIVVPENINLTIDLDGYMLDRNAVNRTTPAATAAAGKRIITNNGTLTIISSNTTRIHKGKVLKGIWIPVEDDQDNTTPITGGLICGGSGNEYGISIYSVNSNCLTLTNITVTGNYGNSSAYGGVCVGSCAKITGCSFLYNRANGGAGIHIGIASTGETDFVDVTNCTFNSNAGYNITGGHDDGNTGNGGAIYQVYGKLVVTNCTFTNNRASCGGAICGLTADGTVLNNCTFTNNEAIDKGGCIWYKGINADAKLIINNCQVANNNVDYANQARHGGAIYSVGSIDIKDSSLTGNVGYFGAALAIEKSTYVPVLHVWNSEFKNNRAIGGAGSIYSINANVYIHSGKFESNSVWKSGYANSVRYGCIYSNGGLLSLEADEGKQIVIANNTSGSTSLQYVANAGVDVANGCQVSLGGNITIENNGNSSHSDYGLTIDANSNISITSDMSGSNILIDMPAGKTIDNPNDTDLSAINSWFTVSQGRDGLDREGYIDPSGNIAVNPTEHLISLIIQGQGTLTTNVTDNKAEENTEVELTYAPTNGYSFSSIKVIDSDNNEIPLTRNVFTMPDKNVFVYVKFSAPPKHDNGPSEVVEEEPEKKFIIQAAPKKEEKKEEPKDFGIKVNDGNLKINFQGSRRLQQFLL